MSNLQELLRRRAELEARILAAQLEERAQALSEIRALMRDFDIGLTDLVGRANKTGSPVKVAAKYRNKLTGETWSGRGLQPKWLKAALSAGASIADFEVKA